MQNTLPSFTKKLRQIILELFAYDNSKLQGAAARLLVYLHSVNINKYHNSFFLFFFSSFLKKKIFTQ